MKSKVSMVWLIVCSVIFFIIGASVTLKVGMEYIGDDGLSILEAHLLIKHRYVGDRDIATYVDETLTAMVGSLDDRWSYYLNKAAYSQLQNIHTNTYKGVGMKVGYVDGEGLKITQIIPNSPAESAGLAIDDVIISINDNEITKENANTLIKSISEAEKFTIVIKHPDDTVESIVLSCETIKQDPITSALTEDNVGVLTIKNFYNDSGSSAVQHIDKLIEKGAEYLVIDVRNNPGGYINEMVTILDRLLPECTICTCATNDGKSVTYGSDAICVDLPIAVVVNEASYSAAEFLAAELQEAAGAKIVGAPTTGKGFAQSVFTLRTGDAIGLSTMRYYTGQGNSLIGQGVSLDVEVLEEEQQIPLAIKEILESR